MVTRATRYSIQRPVEYRLRQNSGSILGTGRTLNISRRGLLFQAERELSVGKRIEILVRMGAALDDSSEITLQIQGITVRCEKQRTAVMIKKYRLKSAESLPQ